MAERQIPKASDFSPSIVELPLLLDICARSAGDREATLEEIRVQFFSGTGAARETAEEQLTQQRKRAGNVLSSLVSYKLYDKSGRLLTSAGDRIRNLGDSDQQHAEFAKHIILELDGLFLLKCCLAIHQRGDRIGKKTLEEELSTHGIRLPTNSTYLTRILQWLAEGKVVAKTEGRDWLISEARVEELTGIRFSDSDEWIGLTASQRAFVKTLRHLAEGVAGRFVPSKEVRELAEDMYGVAFDKSQLNKKIHQPLVAAGWILHETTKAGRGGKSGNVAATEHLLQVPIDILGEESDAGVPTEVRAQLQRPLAEVYRELDAANAHVKGLALEVLAVRMAIALGLEPRGFRLRSKRTGSAEVDLVADGAHLHYSRWIFQCKNKGQVDVSDLAKEIGLAVLLKAHVVVIVTTGTIRSSLQTFAKEVSETSSLQVVLVPARVVRGFMTEGSEVLGNYFREQAQATMVEKQSQLSDLQN